MCDENPPENGWKKSERLQWTENKKIVAGFHYFHLDANYLNYF